MGEMIDIGSGKLQVTAYVAQPATAIKGGLIVIHEVWALTDHIKDIADRFSKEGYLVLAPNLLSDMGLSEQLIGELQGELFDPQTRAQAQPKIRELMAPMQAPGFAQDTLVKLRQCFDYLYGQEVTQRNVAVMGFCFGGSYSFSLAVHEPRLKAAVPFYGHADFSVAELSKIACPVMAFYGEKDDRLMQALPKLKADMKAANVDFTAHVYPECGHAFFNDTNKFTYNESAAKDAMTKTLNFLNVNLS
jgi:carboxymethylenebutenolidase